MLQSIPCYPKIQVKIVIKVKNKCAFFNIFNPIYNSKGAFRAEPRVDSAVVHIKILEKPSADVRDEEFFFRVVRTTLSQSRKTLSNSLKSIREDTKEWLTKAGIDSHRRRETLSIEEFAKISDILRGA